MIRLEGETVEPTKRFAVLGYIDTDCEVLAMYETLSECDAYIEGMCEDGEIQEYDNVNLYDCLTEHLCLYDKGGGGWCYEDTNEPVIE